MTNPLEAWFEAHTAGRGVWKWRHYFEAYDRHLAKFRGQDIDFCEVGIYSGGSLDMWHEYFGPAATIHGVDIQPACQVYESDWCHIHIGDQGSPEFWRRFRNHTPALHAFIDDGSHQPDHQRITLEEVLPYMAPGGVYICEDVHGTLNNFAIYAHEIADRLNDMVPIDSPDVLAVGANAQQRMIHSIHLYPFMAVIEKNVVPVERFEAPKHGTEWQPFRV